VNARTFTVEYIPVSGLKPHPLSDQIFGLMPADQFGDLVRDIADRGIQYPLELDGHGLVIAGSQRLRAVQELQWNEVPAILHREMLDELEIQRFLIKDNVLRRQLTIGQIARAGAKLEEIVGKLAEQRKLATLKQFVGPPNADAPMCPKKEQREPTTRETVAHELGVSKGKYEAARTIFDKGSSDLQDKVERGEVSVFQAVKQVRARPRVQAVQADETKSAALRFARWQKDINDWTKSIGKLTRWVQANPTEELGPYAPKATASVTALRQALDQAREVVGG
jgi:ParB-like chromosome segregation protein Spo0J